jgi:histidinol-phosphate/aromatic aminotransferase/cobyric acid decarboxylase-like protein
MAQVYGRLFGYELRPIRYQYSRSEHKFSIDPTPFLECDEFDVIYLPTPDNLSGSTFDTGLVEKICARNCPVLLDHAYIDFAIPSLGAAQLRLSDLYPNLSISRSFSKIGGVAGVRVGFLYSSSANIARYYEDKPMYEISGIACAYLSFLVNENFILRETVKAILAGKREIETILLEKGAVLLPSSGNFSVFENTPGIVGHLHATAMLRSFEIDGSKFIRITATDPESVRDIFRGM